MAFVKYRFMVYTRDELSQSMTWFDFNGSAMADLVNIDCMAATSPWLRVCICMNCGFVLSFCPLNDGKNELIINTVTAPTSKTKLLVCAYKAELEQ